MKLKTLMVATLTLVLANQALAANQDEQGQRLSSVLSKHGQQGKWLEQAVKTYSAKCGHSGEELTVLIYLGSTTTGNAVLEQMKSARSQAELNKIIPDLDCPI